MLFHYALKVTEPASKRAEVTSSIRISSAAAVMTFVAQEYKNSLLRDAKEYELKISQA
jgi:hypothetical protein